MKKTLLVTGCLVLALGTVGCSKDNKENTPAQQNRQEQTTTTTVSMSDIQESILSEDLLTYESTSIDAKDSYIFESVKDSIQEGFFSQALIKVQFQDIAVIKTSDVKAIKTAIEEYLNSNSIRRFSDGYGGEDNAIAVSNAIVNNVGDYVYYIATTNAKDIEAKLLKILK